MNVYWFQDKKQTGSLSGVSHRRSFSVLRRQTTKLSSSHIVWLVRSTFVGQVDLNTNSRCEMMFYDFIRPHALAQQKEPMCIVYFIYLLCPWTNIDVCFVFIEIERYETIVIFYREFFARGYGIRLIIRTERYV